MIVVARKFLIILLGIAFINIAAHILYSAHLSDCQKGKTHIKIPRKIHQHYPSWNRTVTVNISMNMKILYDMITRPENQENNIVDVQSETPGDDLINISDFRFYYYFNAGVEKRGETMCPVIPPDLGPVAEDKAILSLYGIDDMYLRIQAGGIHIPVECTAQQQVAIVVVVHETNSRIRSYVGSFIYYIHPFLMKQQLEYQIFVILKTNSTGPYKRGELFNIGFKEAQAYRADGWDCVIFHDAHLVPLDTRNLYRCSNRPRRLVADIKKPYRFGGAIAMTPGQFTKVNGFSNQAWSQDNDYIHMCRRLIAAGLTIETNVDPIGNYTTFDFLKQINNQSQETASSNISDYMKDGINTLSYKINNLELKQFYTLINVEPVEVDANKELSTGSSESNRILNVPP